MTSLSASVGVSDVSCRLGGVSTFRRTGNIVACTAGWRRSETTQHPSQVLAAGLITYLFYRDHFIFIICRDHFILILQGSFHIYYLQGSFHTYFTGIISYLLSAWIISYLFCRDHFIFIICRYHFILTILYVLEQHVSKYGIYFILKNVQHPIFICTRTTWK